MTAVATIPALAPNARADAAGQLGDTKYLYPEFAGWVGERYLKKILRQILPMALYRTWEIFVEHQANGNECYLGVPQLAAIAGRTSRTMQKNLAELEAKQLLIERAERKAFGGPDETKKIRAVVVKDFSNLYALAHEYHEWLNTSGYIAPDRAVVVLIARDEPLVAKLRRFDNYRRVLYNQLPGPHPKSREEDRWFTEYQAKAIAPQDAEGQATEAPELPMDRMANKQVAKEVAKQTAKDSPKRISETSQYDHAKGDSCDSVPPLSEKTWQEGRNMPAHPASKDEVSEPEYMKDGGEARSEALDEKVLHLLPSPPSTPSIQHSGQRHRHNKVEAHLERHQVLVEQSRQSPVQGDRSQASEKRSHPPDHPLARSFVHEISAPFGDLNPKGSLTRVLSILAAGDLSHPAEVVWCLVRAYTVARDTRTVRPEHLDARTGRANRMPLFCAMFERFVRARVEAQRWNYPWHQMEEDIAADDRLTLWWNEQQAQYRALTRVQDEVPQGTPHLQGVSSRESPPQKAVHRMSAVLAQQRHRPRLSQTDEEREERARYARTVMARISSMAGAMNEPIIGWEHLTCGCPLTHKRAGKRACAYCFPDPTWPEEVRALIRSIVEARTDGGGPKGTPGEREETLSEANLPGAGNYPGHVPAPGRWTEREEAYVCGKRVLEALVSSGYLAEMMVRPLEEWYQVVLVDEGYELVLETDEQVQFIIEQARAAAVEAHDHSSSTNKPRSKGTSAASRREGERCTRMPAGQSEK